MDLFDAALTDLWRRFNEAGVRYILVGGFAANFHGYQRYTGDVDLFLEDTATNRTNLRKAYRAYSGIDFEGFDRIRFVPGWVDFPLNNGMRLDMMTELVGVKASFEECLSQAIIYDVSGVSVPVLHINHLLANKKAVGRPKDQLDVLQLEKILRLRNDPNDAASGD